MVRHASTESHPKNFPFFPATRPKALTSGSENFCPITPSRNRSGIPSSTSASKKGIKKAPPPWRYALELKPRILAKPTAEPIIDQINPVSLCHIFCLSSPCIKNTSFGPFDTILLRKTTQGGRELTVSPDFKAFSLDDNNLVVEHLEPIGVAPTFEAFLGPLLDYCSSDGKVFLRAEVVAGKR